MPWPFSRSEPDSTGNDAGDGNGRRAAAKDPAAELRSRTRRRLIGAAALLLAAVIVLPMLLDTAPRPVREDISITIASPPPPQPPRKPAEKALPIDEKIAEPAPARSEPPPPDPPAESPPPSPPPVTAAAPQPVAQAEPQSTAARPPVAAAPASEKFAVQVAALSTPAAAKDLVARLKKGGFSAYVEAVSTADSTLHRVRVGPFASREEAQRAAEKMKAAGHKATVVGG
jgi:DedD protein